MREYNEQLRQARERSSSRDMPGVPLSRQELAEQVNAYLFDRTGKRFELDDNYIGKLERGVIRWPQRAYREALREVLGVGSDRDLGFVNTRRLSAGGADVKRQEFLRTAFLGVPALATGSGLLELLLPLGRSEAPRKVGREDIDQVRGAADLLVGWANSHGGEGVRQAANAQLRWFAQLLHAQSSDEIRADLHDAVGLLAHATAHVAFDACAFDDAYHVFRFSLACAEEVESWHLRAKVLSSMARQEVWRGSPDLGLTYAELALVRADRLTATELAMLHTARARALAQLGRYQETLRAVGEADDAFGRAVPANDPPWMSYYDAAQHAGDTGHALFDLAVGGHQTQAAARLQAAIDGHTADYVRSRAMSQTKLASLTMVAGEPEEAIPMGLAALDGVGQVRSRRAATGLAELREHTARHLENPEVAELRRRLTAALAS